MTTMTRRAAPPRIASDTPDHWDELAQCKGENDLMWPLPNAVEQTALAVMQCHGCPVRVQCLLDGIDQDEFESVRGGLPGRQRKTAARKHGRDVDAYPAPQLPVRWCQRCGEAFEPTEAAPLARICTPCAAARAERERRTSLRAGRVPHA